MDICIVGLEKLHGLKCRDVYRYEKINILSKNLFELSSYQEAREWRQ